MEDNFTSFLIQGSNMGGGSAPSPKLPKEAAEGVTGQLTGVPTGLSVSLTQIQVLDMISEGQIEGLISGTYTYSGVLGETGWRSVVFTPFEYPSGENVNYKRSIYWNEVPLVDSDNKFNFQKTLATYTQGLPEGALLSAGNSNFGDELVVARQVSERLRGGDEKFAKIYRILNREVKACRVNIKFTQLSETASKKVRERVLHLPETNPDGSYVSDQYGAHGKPFYQKKTTANVGDVIQTEVVYQIWTRPIFATAGTIRAFELKKVEHVGGKISNGYIRTSLINLVDTKGDGFSAQQDFVGWEIKVSRLTPDAETSRIRNQTFVDSLVEIYGDIFTYPNSAIVCSRFSADYFSQIPSRLFHARLLKVQVPANYEPLTRTYATTGPGTSNGCWDGTFAATKQWTNNPVWCYYDLLTNPRYGLGRYIDSTNIDKWTLYDIGQYCDILVADGWGGLEPRFTCNLILNAAGEAYEVVNNMASVFRAMTYYAAGLIYAVQDVEKSKDLFYQFANSNVEDGNFQYSSSSKRVRHTVAIVRYNDKTNYYKPAVEYVEDIDGIRRYGIREVEVPAFGCTSRGQALRLGRWALLTETTETESVTFTAGMEGAYIRPGDVFKVYDANRKGKRYSGRTRRITHNGTASSTVLLDGYISGLSPTKNYTFSLLTPSYFYDTAYVTGLTSCDSSGIRRNQLQNISFTGGVASGVTTVSDNKTVTEITLPSQFNTGDYTVSGNLVWTIEASGLYDLKTNPDAQVYDYYRALRIEEKENHKYQINGIQYNPSKFLQVESGFVFSSQVTPVIPTSPTNLQLTLENRPGFLHSKQIKYEFTIPNLSGVAAFNVYARTGAWLANDFTNGSGVRFLAATLPNNTTSGYYYPSHNATYYFRVYSVDRVGTSSNSYAEGNKEVTDINPLQDIIINSLQLLQNSDPTGNAAANKSNETFFDATPTFSWAVGGETTDQLFSYRITIREPSVGNIPSSHVYFSGYNFTPDNPSDPYYDFDISDNNNAISSLGVHGPFRNFDVVVEAMDTLGNSSAGGNFLTSSFEDSDYTTFGYDILNVNNPRPAAPTLTPLEYDNLSGWKTRQWITPEGEIKIQLFSGQLESDVDGGYIFYSTGIFIKEEALGIVPSIYGNRINGYFVSNPNNENPITFPVSFTGAKEGYLMFGPVDFFDDPLIATGANISGLLNYSNVVKIKRQGGFDKEPLLFRAWIEMYNWRSNIDITNSTPLYYREAGFSAVVSYANTTGPGTYEHHLIFDQPLATTDYTLMGYQPETTSSKQNDRIILRNVSAHPHQFDIRHGEWGNNFFAVLWNGEV